MDSLDHESWSMTDNKCSSRVLTVGYWPWRSTDGGGVMAATKARAARGGEDGKGAGRWGRGYMGSYIGSANVGCSRRSSSLKVGGSLEVSHAAHKALVPAVLDLLPPNVAGRGGPAGQLACGPLGED